MSSSGRNPWPPDEIWARFSLPVPTTVRPIPSGHSKASVFQIQTPLGDWVLKGCCQKIHQNRSYLSLHDLLKKANLINPEVIPKLPTIALVNYHGFQWELTPWIVGEHRPWNQMEEDHWSAASHFLERVHQSLATAGGQSILPFGKARAFQMRLQILQNAKTEWNHPQPPWPSVFVGHPSWGVIVNCLPEMVDLALFDLIQREKKRVHLQPIHGDPHLGNWLWTGEKPNGLIDFLGPIDPIDVDLARLGSSHGLDPFSVITQVCREYRKQGGQAPEENLAMELAYSGLIARVFRWRKWLLDEPNPGLTALNRVTEIVGQIPGAMAWRKQLG